MNIFDQEYQVKGDYHVRAYESDLGFKKFMDSIKDWFWENVPRSRTILNVGSGEGMEAQLLLEAGFTVDLLDISPEAKKLWDQRMQNNYDSVFYAQDFLTFEKQYDWILIPNTLHWIENETEAVAQIKRLARVGAYITVPDTPRHPLDARNYSPDRLKELFPHSTIYLQDKVRYVCIWRNK